MKKVISSILTATLLSSSLAVAEVVSEETALIGTLPDVATPITLDEITAAQKMWGDAVVAIGAAGDKAHDVAKEAAEAAYAFEFGAIQFKPTLASEAPFRPDLEGTLSYFVSGNEKYSEDKGFALKPWTNVRFDNHTVKTFGNKAIAMGHYYFTDETGTETKVEYTKGYVKTEDGRVLLFLQDSSLPYSG
ncbi:MAG: hypothetical protein AAF191_05895 [Verrucomicrobiota bacterium]